MKYVSEITEMIIDHVGKHDDYLARQDLRNLRLVNKHFCNLATLVLFRTVPFWLGIRSLEHLTMISEHPQISHYVTKLVFSPLRFVKWKDPFSYQSSIRNRFERDTFSHNIFSLSFGKHVAAYKGYVEAQDYLSKRSQDLKILIRALRRLPRLKNMTVVFKSNVIGAQEIMSAFGLLNGNELTLDAEYTLPLLVEALSESGRELDIFKLLCDDEGTSYELFSESRTSFNDKHQIRFKYVSESPANVTAKAFHNAFLGDSTEIRLRVITMVRRLREFEMGGLNIESNDLFAFDQWSSSLEPIIAFAGDLEKLSVNPTISGALREDHQRLYLPSIIYNSTRLSRLRYLVLQHVESPEPLLVALFTGCSDSLVFVALIDVRVIGNGSWSDVFRKSRSANFDALCDFSLLRCGEVKGLVRARNYLKRITDKDPIAECKEQQS